MSHPARRFSDSYARDPESKEGIGCAAVLSRMVLYTLTGQPISTRCSALSIVQSHQHFLIPMPRPHCSPVSFAVTRASGRLGVGF